MKVVKGNLLLEPFGKFVKDGYRVVYESTSVIDPAIAKQNDFPVFLQATDIQTPFINTTSLSYVDDADWVRYPKGRIKRGEVLIEVKGKIEKVALVPDDFPEKALVSGSLYKFTVTSDANKYYLLVYLITKYGQAFKERAKTNLLVSFVSKHELYKIPVPVFSEQFQLQIQSLFERSQSRMDESKASYISAEKALFYSLDLNCWRPSAENTAITSFHESFLKTGRLDAEYYHPEKTRMLELLDKFPGKTVGSYVSEIDEVINPLNDLESEPVMNFDLNDALPIYLDARETELADELGSSKKTFKRGDVVVSRLRSYLKEIAIVDTPEDAKTVGSSEFIVLRPSSALGAEALVVYLRSLPVQLILKWCQSGSNHPRFAEKDLLAIKVPDIVLDIQDTLQSNVRQSIDKSRESKRLLETAKRAVEIAIEQNEDAAMEYISANTQV